MPEVWLQGAIKNIPALLQPVAHALLQAQQEVHIIMQNFPEEKLWQKPAGVASVGFHLLHLTGVLDRLFTYARNESLSKEQLNYLEREKQSSNISIEQLLDAFDSQINIALKQLRETDESTLTNYRGVGRKQLPSTVMGLLFHSAEHTMRHTGQLLVTAKILSADN